MINSYKSTTDSRLVIDVVAPGYAPNDITVLQKKVNDGKDALLIVKGKYTRPRGETDKLVPRLAFDKSIDEKFKLEFPISGDFDLGAIKYAVTNGVIRISVPKTAAAIGTKLTAIADGENVNVIGLDEDE